MQVLVRSSWDAVTEMAASIIENRIRANPATVLGLATGRTMERLYARLAQQRVSFAECSSFNLDEFIGLTRDHPGSYAAYMHKRFFSSVDLPEKRCHLPDGAAPDLVAAAERYENSILESGGIDLQLLGIGQAGHIGFNEPLSSLVSRTRDKTLTPVTRAQNAGYFGGNIESVPTRALTMGVGTILDAKELMLLAAGSEKAEIIVKAVEGPITSMVSASAIQLHPNCTVIVDEAAGALLKGREYYDFVFANEPEWEAYRHL